MFLLFVPSLHSKYSWFPFLDCPITQVWTKCQSGQVNTCNEQLFVCYLFTVNVNLFPWFKNLKKSTFTKGKFKINLADMVFKPYTVVKNQIIHYQFSKCIKLSNDAIVRFFPQIEMKHWSVFEMLCPVSYVTSKNLFTVPSSSMKV